MSPLLLSLLLNALSTAPAVSIAASRGKEPTTPVEKVISLLQKLEEEVTVDGRTEGERYNHFSCFCKDKTKQLSGSIIRSQETIDQQAGTMDEKTADRAAAGKFLQEELGKKEQFAAELKAKEAACAKEKAEYEAANAYLVQAIAALSAATDEINSKRPGVLGTPTGFLTVRQSLQRSPEAAKALRILDEGPHWQLATAFLQESAGAAVDPNDPEYKFHSEGITAILKKLHADFSERKNEGDAEWEKAKQICDDTKQDILTKISLAQGKIGDAQQLIQILTTELAQTRQALVDEEASLKDDKLYMEDLTQLCEARAKDWDQRTKQRAGELDAISEALNILSGKVASAAVVNQRAMLQVRKNAPIAKAAAALMAQNDGLAEGTGFSFLQGGLANTRRAASTVGRLKHGGRGAATEGGRSSEKLRVRRQRALEELRREGQRIGSTALAALAARAAADPFDKVKTLIQKLIERLLSEATSEATKKGFCDQQLGETELARSYRWEEVRKLDSEVRLLEAKKETLAFEIEDLNDYLEKIAIALRQAKQMRETEKEGNQATILTATDGLKAVSNAIYILQAFYKEAAKATVLTQVVASPVDEDTAGVGFEGAYRGKQAASKGIIGLLEVIKSDFDRTIRMTNKAEDEAHAEFVELDRAGKAAFKGKHTKLLLNKGEVKTTDATTANKMQEMADNMELVDKANEQLEALKPMCIDTGMAYTERDEKRDREMRALQKALCILDTNDVEPTCPR